MNIIRKKFLVLTLAVFLPIIVFVVFFASSAMEKIIEVAGTKLVGAEVSLGGADLAFTLTSASLANLQVTDPDEPMKNAFVADSIKFSLDGGKLLGRKVIIDEFSGRGIKLGTDRAKSGAIGNKKKKKKQKKETKEVSASKGLSVDSILEKEKSAIEKSIKTVSSGISKDKARLEDKVENLAGEKELAEYKKRAKKIKSTSSNPLEMLSSVKDAKDLKKDIKRDLKEIKSLSADVKQTIKKHNGAIRKLKEKEVKRLLAKYSPTGIVGEITKSMFSPALSVYVDKALMWSSKVKGSEGGTDKVKEPVRASGRDVHFKEKNPLPDFLIKNAGLSITIPQGELAGSIIDITTDQSTYGKPIKFEFSGTKLKGLDDISIKGSIDRVKAGKPRDFLELNLAGLEFDKVKFGDFILQGEANITSKTEILKDGFTSKIRIIFTNAKFSSSEGFSNKALLDGLNGLGAFTVRAEVSGKPDDYSIKIKSGLDEVAKKVVGRAVTKQTKEFEAKLRDGLEKQMSTGVSGLKSQVGDIGGINKDLKDKSNLIGGLTP